MTKHKTEDYKISAVKYYLNNDKGDGYKKTCKIFDCKKSTLRDWIKQYKLFRKAGFQTYLVDEFRTSCMCSKCEVGICKKTMVRENPKPYRSGNILIHGLICCKNGCGYWNRDVNGATNIYKIAYNAINNKKRPNYLSRSKNLSTGLDEPVKPKFTRSAKSKPF
mgnify:CR=1 FL=1